MKKIIGKVVFWTITAFVVMFIGCWTLSTASRMHIGENLGSAVTNGFGEVADEIFKVVGLNKQEPDVVLNFRNGKIGFGNTHISWGP